jgi:hypothetical protein
MKRIMNTVCAGMSTFFTGAPPNAHAVGGYGDFIPAFSLLALVSQSGGLRITIEGGMPPGDAILVTKNRFPKARSSVSA